MKKFTFLLLLTAFFAVNLSGQTPAVKTNPAMDSKNEVNILVDNNDGVIVSIENSESNRNYILVQTDPAQGKIETIKGNSSTVEFKKLSFSKKGSTSYMILKDDFSSVGKFIVKAKKNSIGLKK